MNSYLLVDTAEIGGPDPFLKDVVKADSTWVASLYREEDFAVSPILIDIEAARQAGVVEAIAGLVEAKSPPLHVSYVESDLAHHGIVAHLRKFILVRDESGEEYTFRFADGLAFEIAASVFKPPQANAFFESISSWRIHRIDGGISELAIQVDAGPAAIAPLVLDESQCDRIDASVRIYSVLAYVRRCAASKSLPGAEADWLAWVSKAVEDLREVGRDDEELQKHLGLAAVESGGDLFDRHEFKLMLATSERSVLMAKASELIAVPVATK